MKKGIVEKNIAQKIKKPSVEQKEVEYLSWEEVEEILLTVPQEDKNYLRNLSILRLFYYNGVRLDELKNIRVTDFNPDLSELLVVKGKGDKPRLLPVHSFVQRVLKLYLTTRETNSSYLFPGRNGDKPLNESTIYELIKNYGSKLGNGKRVSPHTFRHLFATHLHQKGVDIYRLKKLLGHANIEKTAIYTHTEDAELIEAVSKLD